MGFSGIVSQIMLVFTMMGIIVLVIVTYKGYVLDTNAAIQLQEEKLQQKINTNILITSVTYEEPSIIVVVKNTGSIVISPGDLDVYVDDIRIPRDEANRTFEIINNVVNEQHLDPAESIRINISKELQPGNHRVEVVALHGVRNAEIITL